MGGPEPTPRALDEQWDAWTPTVVAARLSGVAVPWYVAGGWALELFTPDAARPHADLEIAVPAGRFGEVAAALPGFEWEVAGDGRVWPFPEHADEHHQTWLRDPATGRYRLDVFREPHRGDTWVCRRDPAITLPYPELIRYTADGIPYATPEVVLLFKAKHRRDKDDRDFERVAARMTAAQRRRLGEWLTRVHPGHPWAAGVLTTRPDRFPGETPHPRAD